MRIADAAHAAGNHAAGLDVEHHFRRIADFHMAEVVFRHVGGHPAVASGDEGHDRRSRPGELAQIRPQIGDHPIAGRPDRGLGEVELRLGQRAAGGDQPVVIVADIAPRLSRLDHLRLRGGDLAGQDPSDRMVRARMRGPVSAGLRVRRAFKGIMT